MSRKVIGQPLIAADGAHGSNVRVEVEAACLDLRVTSMIPIRTTVLRISEMTFV